MHHDALHTHSWFMQGEAMDQEHFCTSLRSFTLVKIRKYILVCALWVTLPASVIKAARNLAKMCQKISFL